MHTHTRPMNNDDALQPHGTGLTMFPTRGPRQTLRMGAAVSLRFSISYVFLKYFDCFMPILSVNGMQQIDNNRDDKKCHFLINWQIPLQAILATRSIRISMRSIRKGSGKESRTRISCRMLSAQQRRCRCPRRLRVCCCCCCFDFVVVIVWMETLFQTLLTARKVTPSSGASRPMMTGASPWTIHCRWAIWPRRILLYVHSFLLIVFRNSLVSLEMVRMFYWAMNSLKITAISDSDRLLQETRRDAAGCGVKCCKFKDHQWWDGEGI